MRTGIVRSVRARSRAPGSPHARPTAAVGYFHVVFTLPAEVADIAYQNKAVACDLLFLAASETMLTIAADPRHLGARIGITAVMHTWGSAMTHHPHVHMIVPGGGLLAGTPYEAMDAGNSLSIRIQTPGIDPMLPFEREQQKVRTGLEAIRDLIAWLMSHRQALAEVILPFAGSETPAEPAAAPVRSDRHPKEAEFTEALWATYRECSGLGYKPTGMLDMMQRLGGIGTARQLLAGQ